MRRDQLLEKFLENWINTRSLTLDLELHPISHHRWGKSPELPVQTAGTTITKVTICNTLRRHGLKPSKPVRSPCLNQHMFRPIYRLPEAIWMIQRKTGRISSGQMRSKWNTLVQTLRCVWRDKNAGLQWLQKNISRFCNGLASLQTSIQYRDCGGS